MTARYIKFARRYEQTHEELRRYVEAKREPDKHERKRLAAQNFQQTGERA